MEATTVKTTAYIGSGYEAVCTGGNCLGYIKHFENGTHILITAAETEAKLPENATEPVIAGLYAENGVWLATMNANSFGEIMQKIDNGEWEKAA